LNVFEQSGGAGYVETLRELFANSQDFRETDYYAPPSIAWSSFIGRSDDTFSARLSLDGIVEPNALDQLLVGNGVQLEAASRDALVYNESGEYLDYYEKPDAYRKNLEKRITFSDHFFNIVRLK
jgi:hypothetical protein